MNASISSSSSDRVNREELMSDEEDDVIINRILEQCTTEGTTDSDNLKGGGKDPGYEETLHEEKLVKEEYTDHFMDPIVEQGESFFLTRREKGGKLLKRLQNKFPYVLYSVLEDPAFKHIVSWQAHGRAFVIKSRHEFIRAVMPRFFSATQYSSFTRQLNWYRFNRIKSGCERDIYYHEYLLRGRPDLTEKVRRFTTAAKSPLKTIPRFYDYPFCIELMDQDIAYLADKTLEEIQVAQRSNDIAASTNFTRRSLYKQQELPNYEQSDDVVASRGNDYLSWLIDYGQNPQNSSWLQQQLLQSNEDDLDPPCLSAAFHRW